MIQGCPFCRETLSAEQIVLESEHCLFLQRDEPVLQGSGLIVPKAHRRTVFDLSPEEVSDTFRLLHRAKDLIDECNRPAGYNIGWNCGRAAGQEIFHAHLHVIPRYEDEPHAGKGMRHWIKQQDNRRLK